MRPVRGDGGPSQLDGFDRVGRRWGNFLRETRATLVLWVFAMGVLGALRLLLIGLFRHRVDPGSGIGEIVLAVGQGARFDATVATAFILLPLVAGLGCLATDMGRIVGRVRATAAAVFVVGTTILGLVTVGFLRVFGDQINGLALNLFYDDTSAILSTIASEFPLGAYFAAAAVLLVAGLLVLHRMLSRLDNRGDDARRRNPSLAWKAVILLGLVAVVGVGIRGSVGRRPVQQRDAAILADDFLNRLIANPFHAVRFVAKRHARLSRASGLHEFVPDGDLRGAAASLFPHAGAAEYPEDLLARSSAGTAARPRHVILIIMESYDTWSLLPAYRSLRLSDRLRALGENGAVITNLLPASNGTMDVVAALVSGIPDAGVKTNYQPSARRPYATSIAPMFKRLGFRTRLFYGGYLAWEDIGEFARWQGFDEVFGAGHMTSWSVANEWGVDDRSLFRFVLDNDQVEEPTFSVILTTGYHPPFGVDVFAEGFPTRRVPDDVAGAWDGSTTLKVLGHLWFADRSLGEFVEEWEARESMTLFAITGDHSGRQFVNGRPSFFERAAVPCVLFGPAVLPGQPVPRGSFGSHLDLIPTLVERSAPAGFHYHAFGTDLLSPLAATRAAAYGRFRAIGPGFVADLESEKSFPVPGEPLAGAPRPSPEVRAGHDAWHGLAWWMIRHPGEPLPSGGRPGAHGEWGVEASSLTRGRIPE